MRSMPFRWVVMLVFVSFREIPVLKASMTESFKLNQSLGRTLVEQAQSGLTSGSLPLEGMGQEAPISESSVSHENVSKALKDSEMGQYVLEQEKRPDKKRVVIDPVHDPLMAASTEVIQDPLKVLKADVTVIREEGGEILEEHLCEDPAEPLELACVQDLQVTVKNPGYETHIVTAYIHGNLRALKGLKAVVKLWDGPGIFYARSQTMRYAHNDGHSSFFEEFPEPSDPFPVGTVSPDITSFLKEADRATLTSKVLGADAFFWLATPQTYPRYCAPENGVYCFTDFNDKQSYPGKILSGTMRFEVSFKRKPEITEHWQSGCAALDALSNDEGTSPCDLIEEKCTQGPETRVINGIPITRDCWQKKRFYLCGSGLPGTCGEYRIRGCSQTNSTCIQKVGEHCIRWKQTYQCRKKGVTRTRTAIKGEGVPWCLDGNCYSPSWEANTDMLTAMSRMAVLAQIQKDMKDLSVFTGQGLQCRRTCLEFQNCCGTERGWGLDIRFAACNDEEKLLAQKQKNGLCVFLGTYCSKRVLGACVQKKSTSCCYASRIARIIQVAAHQQLGLSWGTPEHPQCSGLTPEQLSKLDLEKVDFRELYEEIMTRYKAPQIITPQKEVLSKTVQSVSQGDPVSNAEGM